MFLSLCVFCNFPLTYSNIVKLTAQFVARNGRQFLSNLMNREQVMIGSHLLFEDLTDELARERAF